MSFISFFSAEFNKQRLTFLRNKTLIITPILFFSLLLLLCILSTTPDLNFLKKMLFGLSFIFLLISLMLSIDNLFLKEYQSGALVQYLLLDIDSYLVVLSKIICFWLWFALPLVLLGPLFALSVGFNWYQTSIIFFTLLFCSPSMVTLLAILSALTINTNNHHILIPIIILPLIIPVVIFGSQSLLIATMGIVPLTIFSLLIASSLLFLSLGPWVIEKILLLQLE